MLAGAAPASFEVALWANDDRADKVPEVVRSGSHPCGAIVIVRLSRMPPYRAGTDRAVGTELIVETGRDGREVGRWSVPVDYEPLAVAGRELLISHGGQRLWIATDGSIRRERGGKAYPALSAKQCPSKGVHANSDYAICASLPDAASGAVRHIQFEGPCT
jgi:hypothetical protein